MKTMIDLILQNGTIITMDKKRQVLRNAGVAVDGGKIVCVGPAEEVSRTYTAKKIIDCENHVVLPGFIDVHGHGGHSFLRFVVKDTAHWMPAMTHTYKHYISDEYFYYEGRVTALERLKAGVTTGVCVLGSQPRCDSPVFAHSNAKGYAEIGVRDIVCVGPCSTPWPHNFSRWEGDKRIQRAVPFEETVKSLEYVIKTLNKTNNNKTFAYVTPFKIVTSLDTNGPTPKDQLTKLTDHDKLQAKEMRRIATEYDTRIHSDVFGGMLELLKEDLSYALIGPDVHLQHCSYISDDEIKIMADSGTSAAVCPWSNAPVHKMLDAGINMAITSDGSKTDCGFDLFGCMRHFQNSYRNLAKDPSLIPDAKALEMVTIDAAKAVGLDHILGSIEPGKQADIITVNMLNPKLTPNFNLLFSLIQNAHATDVDNVIIDGELLMEDRKTNVNEKEILLSAQKEADKTIERAIGLHKMAHIDENNWGKPRKPHLDEPFDIEWQRRDGGHY
ncbi:MAG: amidohydrolase family protein [Treponema sp.]|nr:amidohydrolase family protein [Treponema sp.]